MAPREYIKKHDIYNTGDKCNYTGLPIFGGKCSCFIHRKQNNPSYINFNPSVEKQMNEETQKFVTGNDGAFNENDSKKQSKLNAKIFKDLGDSFDFDQSMRQFYATPNTKIPNDQKSFAEFLYGDMVSCKEGHELACIRHNPRHINY